MKMYNSFINDSDFKFNKRMLKFKIENLKNWIYDNKGLGLINIILDIFNENNYYSDQNDMIKEKDKFFKDLEYLKLTGFPKYIINSKLNRIDNFKMIKTYQDGEYKWDRVNKLNTNYSDLSDLLVYIIEKMINDTNEKIRNFGINTYNSIISDPKLGLLDIKPRLKNIITHYLIDNSEEPIIDNKKGLNDFRKFTKNIIINSAKGQHAENMVENHLKLNGFDILVKGGDGDLIDMLYGVDMVVYRSDIGYKSIQIKTYKPNEEYLNRYKTDWLIVYKNNNPQIIDIKTKEIINL